MSEILNNLQESSTEIGGAIISFIPNALLGLGLILLGWIIAKLFKSITKRLLNKVGFQKLTNTGALKELKLSSLANEFIPSTIYWAVILIFLLAVSDLLELSFITGAIYSIIAFIPSVITAIIVLLISFTVAGVVKNLVNNALIDNPKVNLFSSLASYSIIIFGSIMAVSQLGLDLSVITDNITILIAGLALAIGLGGQHKVKELLDKWTK